MSCIFFQRVNHHANSRHLTLCLHLANVVDFEGDYVVTSTNPNLEGIHYQNWWKFANQKSVDAALHIKCGSNYLRQKSQEAARRKFGFDGDRVLPFGECIVTDAGPCLKVNKIVHSCVPVHPHSDIANDGRAIPVELHRNFAIDEVEAMDLLTRSYRNIFAAVLCEWRTSYWKRWMRHWYGNTERNELKVCVPAIGCGYNGYPIKEAAEIAVDAVWKVGNSKEDMLVEFRLLHLNVFQIWEAVIDESIHFERV